MNILGATKLYTYIYIIKSIYNNIILYNEPQVYANKNKIISNLIYILTYINTIL